MRRRFKRKEKNWIINGRKTQRQGVRKRESHEFKLTTLEADEVIRFLRK